ncbi:MAG: GDSL-type esterase/lipase family protein [Huintestinicola sp.]
MKLSSYYERKKKQGMKFRISFVFLFVFASFIACFTLYMRSDELPKQHDSEVVTIKEDMNPDESERTSTADINPIAESDPKDKSYFDSCMFAGDSLIVGLGSYGFIPEDRIAAGVGMSVMSINSTPLTNPDGSEILAADKINAAAPENLYVLLGLNLLGMYTDEQLLAAYGDFIDSIDREKTNIYIISVPPVTGEREINEENPILNSDIDSFNSDLLKFANNRCVYFVDLNTALKGSDGRFPVEYAEADGIHFMRSTYTLMLDFLLSHVYSE